MRRRFFVQNMSSQSSATAKAKRYAIYGVGCVLLASGLNYKFAHECVVGLRAIGQVVTMTEE